MIVMGVLTFMFAYLRRFHGGRIALDVQHDLRTAIFRQLQRLDFARVANARAEFPAVAECCFDDAAEVGDVDDDLCESGRDQALDLPHDEWLAARHEQRLGELV